MRWLFLAGLALLLATACRPARTPIISTPVADATLVSPLVTAVVTRSTDRAAFLGAPYTIAVIVATSGEAATLGQPQALAAQFLSQQLAADGLTGPDNILHPVEVVVVDSRSTPPGAAAAWDTLQARGEMTVVVGGTTEAEALALAERAGAQQTPFISLAHTAADNQDGWVFTAQAAPALAWQAPLEYLLTQGATRLCYLDAHPLDTPDTPQQHLAALQAAGLHVVLHQTLAPEGIDATQLVALVAGCDAVALHALPAAAAQIVLALRSTTAVPVVGLTPAVCALTFVQQAAAAAEGVVAPCPPVALLDTLPAEFPGASAARAYAALYASVENGASLEAASGYAWDALQATLFALQQLEDGLDMSARRAGVRQALANPDAGWAETLHTPLPLGRVQAGAWIHWPPPRWTP